MRLAVPIIMSAVLGAAAALFSGCGLKPQPPLRVGVNIWPGYEPLFLARALGRFEGLRVKLIEFPNTPEAIRSFQNGAIEAVALTSDEFIRLASQEPDLRAVLVMDISNGADALLARPELRSLPELRGRRVGVEVNAAGVYMLSRALDCAGLSLDDIEVVPLSCELHENALLSKKVDAVVTFEPRRTRLVEKGQRVLFDSSRIPGEVLDFLVVRKSTLESRRADLDLLVQSWFEAGWFIETNRATAYRLMAPRERLTANDFGRCMDLLQLASKAANRDILETRVNDTHERLRRMRELMVKAKVPVREMPGPEIFDGGLVR